jgi:hypothetical protein
MLPLDRRIAEEHAQPGPFGKRPVQRRNRAEEVLIDRPVREFLRLGGVLPHMSENIIGNLLAACEPIDHVLVTGTAELHDDVVNGCGESRIANQPQPKLVRRLITMQNAIAERDDRVRPEGIEHRIDGCDGDRRPSLRRERRRAGNERQHESERT